MSLSISPLTHPKFITQLSITGLALVVASLLYLVGANWFMIPDGVQIGITTTLMAGFGLASVKLTGAFKDATETASGAMIGLTLAVIGQIYQTGADSFWLFVIWSGLLVPWLYRANVGIFVLFNVVIQLALWLFFKQNDIDSYHIPSASLVAIGLFVVSVRHHQRLFYPFILWLGVLSLMAAFSLDKAMLNDDNLAISINALAILTPLIGVFYAKRQNNALAVSLSVSGLAVSLFAYAMLQIIYAMSQLFGEINYIAIAIISMVWFGLVGALLFKFFPKGKYHAIPFGLGGWFAGLFLTVFFLYGFLLSSLLALIFALIFMGISIMLFIKAKDMIFLRHLGYCLMATGQAVFYASLYDVLNLDSLALPIVLQLITLGLCHRLGVHWLYLLGQMWALYTLIGVQLLEFDTSHIVWSYGVMLIIGVLPVLGLFAKRPLPNAPYRALAIFVMMAMASLSVYGHLNLSDTPKSVGLFDDYHELLFCLPILVGLFYQFRATADTLTLAVFGVLALVLGVFGHIELFFALMLLAFAITRQDKLLHGLAVVLVIGLLWQLYYDLNLPFLYKFISILVSGGLVLGLSRWLQHTHPNTPIPNAQTQDTQGVSP